MGELAVLLFDSMELVGRVDEFVDDFEDSAALEIVLDVQFIVQSPKFCNLLLSIVKVCDIFGIDVKAEVGVARARHSR